MILDGALLFTGTSNGASGGITSTANTDTLAQVVGTYICSNIVDIGVNSGIPASPAGGGARDFGIERTLKLLVAIPVAVTSGGSPTVQFEIDGAPDSGTGTPGTYYTMLQSQAITMANLSLGARPFDVDIPRPPPGQALPRFFRFRFIVAGATITAGTVEAAIVLNRFDGIVSTVGNLSGYPAGITVAN